MGAGSDDIRFDETDLGGAYAAERGDIVVRFIFRCEIVGEGADGDNEGIVPRCGDGHWVVTAVSGCGDDNDARFPQLFHSLVDRVRPVGAVHRAHQ